MYTKSCRGSSIKTRIETSQFYCLGIGCNNVAEVVPLKQGLKRHAQSGFHVGFYNVAEVVPLKQGLKHV